jgi:hypothetical protein
MDDSVFTYDFGESQLILAPAEWRDYCIFYHCNAKLSVFLSRMPSVVNPGSFHHQGPRKSFHRLVSSSSFGTLPVCVGFEAT